MKTIKLVFTICLLIAINKSCVPDDTPIIPKAKLIEGVAIMVTENEKTPFIFSHENGGKSAMIDENLNGFYDKMAYSENGLEIVIELNENTGLPQKMYSSEGAVFIYNYKENNTLLDIAIIEKELTISYVRDIETGLNSATGKSSNFSLKSQTDTLEALQGTVSAMSLAWSAGSCIFYASANFASAGVTAPVTLPATFIACGGFLADFLLFVESASDIDNQWSQQINNARSALSLIGDYSGCATNGNIADCISLGLSAIDGILNIVEAVKLLVGEENENLAEGALISGYGAIKITLTWNTTSDIDLWVNEPNGNKIYFDSPASNSGGILDFDDIDGFGPENIFWKENAPLGNYSVQVHYYDDNGAGITNYSVQMEVQGSVQVLQGTLVAEDQLNDVATFAIGTTGKSSTFTKLENTSIKVLKTRKANRTTTINPTK